MALLGIFAAAAAAALTLPPATELRRIPAAEARQGVAVDGNNVYAITNNRIGRYDRRTGAKTAEWQGDPAEFIHINSCTVAGRDLVCAASNFPGVPMASSIEWFDARTLRHMRTRSLGPGRGSLTWLEWHGGNWWACFAHYDDKGGEPERDHTATVLVRYDRSMIEQEAWLFPQTVLERFAPHSSSGGAFIDDRLYVTGHDLPEIYVLALPRAGSRLEHVATIANSTPGQAIQWDKTARTLWSIDRRKGELVESRLPSVPVPSSAP